MPLRSIRTRLTLWYLGILTLILVVFASGVYFTLRRTLNENLNDAIENRALLTRKLVSVDRSGVPTFGIGQSTDPNLDDHFERIFDRTRTLVHDNSAPFGTVDVDASAIDAAIAGRQTIRSSGSGDREVRIVTLPLERDGAIVGVLQVGESTADVRDALRTLLLGFAIALPGALVLATLGGYWLASRALSPIDRVTRAAQDISAHDLSRRLGLDLPDDEVGRLARTLDGMIARLDAAFARQRQFTADASHELRTPLTAIRGQIDVALQRPRDAAAYEAVLATINDQVDRMTRLVGGLLMLARTDAGVLTPERAPVDVAETVNAVAAQMRPLAEAKGLTLSAAAEAGARVQGDADLLLQMLMNLTDNAIKYTVAGGVRLSCEETGDAVTIRVSDTGPGIPAEHRDRVFERFYRVSASRDQGGAGLGLAICRWIAEAHGGTIQLEPSTTGSTFVVRLPVQAGSPPR